MIDFLKQWLERKKRGGIDIANLPNPKTIGDQPLMASRLIVLDLETTGLNPAKDQMIAIGAVAINNNAIPLNDQFDLILRRPELDIRKTVLIHGIGPEALTDGRETEDALLHLLDWMDGDPILAYHSAFDQKFLEKTLRAVLGYGENHIWLDVAELMPAFFPSVNTRGKGLDNWADIFGVHASTRHHAAADAMVTAELTLIALNKAAQQGIHTLAELSNKLRYQRRLRNIQRF
ncbi:3'-5' exonuclease [Marinobacter sp. M3C]|jgi:DNA polymerase-3 subunit epsilon|uniref:3'-5' exonuclease n=1 Tax=unclassified Marinobacter TaxID=83889 RepID=UPI00200F9B3E|nr:MULTISPECIES: 3'-5' exonuclease [unclassified Marinobacter]MCL1476931.1 3'-5' exonuclease [Marinobacter sp.]MCL1482745.1 3'-5' exonuclease [Marinobacter sp.]MCL1483437.1 3'-5' exonuclease [Marinobacter sp.]MCL1488301.1 3'-5' exonuclease [Marinobacter sp.]UQG57556.1 3'-5' exonuclease [Marinobacter sp. M4C]